MWGAVNKHFFSLPNKPGLNFIKSKMLVHKTSATEKREEVKMPWGPGLEEQ